MNGVWWQYGMNAKDGICLVMMRSALLPGVIDPEILPVPMAYDEFIVQALNASSGVSLILMQPSAITNLMLPEGDDPGL